MPITTAAGPISAIEELLADSLAACTAFRELCAVTTSAAARQRIHFDSLPPPPDGADQYTVKQLEDLRPYAIIYTEVDAALHFRRDARPNQVRAGGMLVVQIETNIDARDLAPEDPAEYMRKAKNTLGRIAITEDVDNPGLLDLSGGAGYVDIRQLTVSGPYRSKEEERSEQGDYLFGWLDIVWGNE